MAGSAPVTGGDYFIQDNFARAVRFEVAGYSGASALTDFPVLVRLLPSRIPGFSYGDFYLRNGRDMVFLDASGNLVPHEIDTWNTEGESLVWVKLPSMTNGTVFSMCYRSPMADVLVDPGTPWTKYTGVWHLGETEDGDTDLADSTPNGLTGWAHARSLAAPDGRIGGARRVAHSTGSSASHGQIVVADNAAHALDVGTSFSFSFWMNPQGPADYAYLATRKDTDYMQAWGFQASDHTSYRSLRMWSDEVGVNKPNTAYYFTTDRMSDGVSGLYTWYYVVVTYAGRTATIYIDGQSVGSITLHGLPAVDSSFDNLVFGGCGTGYGAFDGYMDEIRYAPSTLSAAWVAADYATQANEDFLSASAVHMGAESVVPVIDWRQGEDLPESIIDTSFAYVQFAGTVRFCGTGASATDIQYRLWADGNPEPPIDEWQTLVTGLSEGDTFSVPVPGLAMDTPYHFEIRAVNDNPGGSMANTELRGTFRTYGNGEPGTGGEVYRLKNRYVHVFSCLDEVQTFVTPDYVTEVQILVVGGGGAGGYRIGGGGGGGAVRYETSYAVSSNTSYQVTVGCGGEPSTSASQLGGNGSTSSFALGGTTLISCGGGGAGGNYNATASATITRGATGACGGGSYGHVVSGGTGTVGHDGGIGNSNTDRWSAGGGGGMVSKGSTATPDNPAFGGAGGRGFACRITGELNYYGAGGGGGVQYRYNDNTQNYAGPGTGGSGTGGTGANPVEKTPATAGLSGTGSGGGGGSVDVDNTAANYVGAAGADGIVVIAYEIRGDEEMESEPQISLTAVSYQPTNWLATVEYRLGWAGVDEDYDTVYVIYSESYEDAAAGIGTRVPVRADVVGIGTGDFEVPFTATNYYVRLVAETQSGLSVMSDEILMFEVPGLNEDRTAWHEAASGELADGHAEIVYRFHWDRAHKDSVRLLLLWSEDESALHGDGANAFVFEYGQGYVLDGVQQGTLSFFDPRLERGKTYYTRLKCVDELGGRTAYSPEILPFSIPEVVAWLTLSPNYANGTVSGVTTTGDAHPIGSEVVVSATPASGYYLAGWKTASTAGELASAGFAPNSIGRTRYALVLEEDTWIVPVFKELETMILRGVQRYPWNNLVDIDYYLKDDVTNARLVFMVTDEVSGRTVTMRSFRDNTDVSQPITVGGTPALRQPGWHRITWDANADGVAVFSRNVTYTLQVCQGVER